MDSDPTPQNQPEPPQQAPAPAPMPTTAPAPAQFQPGPPMAQQASGNGSGFAIAALVLGIIAFLFSWLSFLNLPACILAIVFGIVSLNKHQSKGMGLTGLILGGIGLLATIAWFIFAVIIAANK